MPHDLLRDLLTRALDYFQAGGPVMVPLAVVSLVLWTLAIHKLRWFAAQRRLEAQGDGSDESCEKGAAPWQADILARYRLGRGPDPELNRELLAALRIPHEADGMRHVGTVLMLAAVAPLLGLLGTVSGMIATFDVIAQFGTGNARALASGISEALVTTQTGLVVAVPGMLLGGFLHRLARWRAARMELFCILLQQEMDAEPPDRARRSPNHGHSRFRSAAPSPAPTREAAP